MHTLNVKYFLFQDKRISTRMAAAATLSWKQQCRELIDTLSGNEDSIPFQYPVNVVDHPDYLQAVDRPMDLSTVREELNVSYMSGYNFHDECDKNFTDFRRRWVITRIPTNLPRTFDSFLRTQRTTIPTKSHEFMP